MKNKIIELIQKEIKSTREALFEGKNLEDREYVERVCRYLEFFLIPEIEKIND